MRSFRVTFLYRLLLVVKIVCAHNYLLYLLISFWLFVQLIILYISMNVCLRF
jgi:hypothetical protein